MSATERELLRMAAQVACDLSGGQADALAMEIRSCAAPMVITEVVGLPSPKSVRELTAAWGDTSAIDGPTLARALECAAMAVAAVTSYEKVELVYTGPYTDRLRRNDQAMLEVIRGARERLWVTTHNIGNNVDEFLDAMAERAAAGVEVRLVADHLVPATKARLPHIDARIHPAQRLEWPEDKRATFNDWTASFHAKCAVADARVAFVTSANLSVFAQRENIEVGHLITGGHTPRTLAAYFEELRMRGELVAPSSLAG
jgi:cardiolipin synthase